MMFAVWAFSLTLSSLLVTLINGTGLELLEPPPGSKNVCSALGSDLTFRCTTTGRGDTLLTFERISVPEFRFRHSRYTSTTPNQNENQTRLNNEIRGGNLLRSDSKDCFDILRNNVSDYCYTTSLVVLPTSRTLCGVVVCRTVFNNGTGDQPHNFGRAVIARTPPQPTGLRVTTISPESVTLVWEAGTSTDCSKIIYEVKTNNCGNCPPTVMTMDSNITCNDLVAGQMCNVSVRSMLECRAFSDPRTMKVLIPEAPTTTKDNSRIALGAGLGISLPLACIAILIIIGVIGALIYEKKSAKRYDVQPIREIIPTMDNHETTKGENGANTLSDDAKAIAKDRAGDISVDRQQLLPKGEISLDETNVDPVEPVEDFGVNQQEQLLLPRTPDPDQSIPPAEAETETDEKGTSGTNVVVAPVPKQTSSIVAMESEEVVDSQNVDGVSTDTFQPSIQSCTAEESTVKQKPTAIVVSSPSVKTTGVPCQQEDTGAAASRDVPIAMLLPSVQAFSSSTENGKQSTSSVVSQGDSMKPDNTHETAPNQNVTEGGRPVSQDSELTPKDSEGEVPPKMLVILSDNEDGPAQAVAIKGAQNFMNVNVAGSCPVADILKKHEERLTNLEAFQLDSNTKIDTLNAQIASLLEQLETMRTDYAALEKKSEEERQRHHKEEERLKKVIKQLREELAAEKKRAEKLEKENKTMPRKALPTETNTLDIRPPYQRTKSLPAKT